MSFIEMSHHAVVAHVLDMQIKFEKKLHLVRDVANNFHYCVNYFHRDVRNYFLTYDLGIQQ